MFGKPRGGKTGIPHRLEERGAESTHTLIVDKTDTLHCFSTHKSPPLSPTHPNSPHNPKPPSNIPITGGAYLPYAPPHAHQYIVVRRDPLPHYVHVKGEELPHGGAHGEEAQGEDGEDGAEAWVGVGRGGCG